MFLSVCVGFVSHIAKEGEEVSEKSHADKIPSLLKLSLKAVARHLNTLSIAYVPHDLRCVVVCVAPSLVVACLPLRLSFESLL